MIKSTNKKNRYCFLKLVFFCPIFLQSQSSPFLDSLLKASIPTFSNVLEQPNKYKVQVFYTTINRDADNKPNFHNYRFHSNKNYFYPASTVKLPIGIAAMIKLEELNQKGLNKETAIVGNAWSVGSRSGIPVYFTLTKIATIGNHSGFFIQSLLI